MSDEHKHTQTIGQARINWGLGALLKGLGALPFGIPGVLFIYLFIYYYFFIYL